MNISKSKYVNEDVKRGIEQNKLRRGKIGCLEERKEEGKGELLGYFKRLMTWHLRSCSPGWPDDVVTNQLMALVTSLQL